jgi:hypothetical protein
VECITELVKKLPDPLPRVAYKNWAIRRAYAEFAIIEFVSGALPEPRYRKSLVKSTQPVGVRSFKNGNIIIDVAGFQYSRPKIKLGIKASYVKSKNSSKRVTITCVQGKTQKKISAVKPQCPKGYVKKK